MFVSISTRVLKVVIPLLAFYAIVEVIPAQVDSGIYLSPKLSDGRQRAFPTAEGFGAAAKGGRNGKIIYVTNLKEAGEGSLRACIEAADFRNCVFRIGGTITLDVSSLIIRNPFITIAGETAPGGGIAIRNGAFQTRPSVEIRTHDVVIRHIRLRPGPHSIYSCCSGALGMYTTAATDIMLDHISASWGSDETIDSENAGDFTWQWGLVGEPLLNGGPGKKNRARNMLLTKAGNLTIHHTLFTLGIFRNPQIELNNPASFADIVNNVMYSPKWEYVVLFDHRRSQIKANVVGNYKIQGEKLEDDHLVHLWFGEGGGEIGNGYAIYVKDNYDEPYRTDLTKPDNLVLEPEQRQYAVSAPFPVPPVHTTSPLDAYAAVLANAGATRPKRDSVDIRLVQDVISRSGKILKRDPVSVGGWPELTSGTPYHDSDKDGISDNWETKHGLDPMSATDGQEDRDGDGWTNFEEFLHELAGDTPATP